MDNIFSHLIFYILAAAVVIFSILSVTTRRVLRAATYLLIVLFGIAGIYFHMNYIFLGAVQLTIYAGGIIVLYVFSILLTHNPGVRYETLKKKRILAGVVAAGAGLLVCSFLFFKYKFIASSFTGAEPQVKAIGHALMGTGKYQYILPFEALSVLLLACIIGGIMIARKK